MTAKTVEKSLLVLETLAASAEPRGVAELSRELAMPKSNVFRLLDTLALHRYVRRRPEDNRYEATLKLWKLGNQVVSRTNLNQIARPFLDILAEKTHESAHLAVLDDGESVYIDKKDGPHPIGGFTKIGSRAPAHCCATGKVELAYRSQEQIDQIAKQLQPFTPSTITTPENLNKEIRQIRSQGYAINRGEWSKDVWGIAAAIRGESGAAIASVGIWGPKSRIVKVTTRSAMAVMDTAEKISAAMGLTVTNIRATTKRRASR